jgi:hypothetical protein
VNATERSGLVVSLRWEFRRHHLSEHERLLADWLLDLTHVAGRDSVKVSRLDDLGGLAGMDRSHVHRGLKSLVEMQIVRAVKLEGAVAYAINTDPANWKCRFRQSRAHIREALQIIQATNGSDTQFFVRASRQQAASDAAEAPGFFDQPTLPFFNAPDVAFPATEPGTEN